jgi:hypothetical protein
MYRRAASESLVTEPLLDKMIADHPDIIQIKGAPEAEHVATAAKAAVKKASRLG